MEQHGGRAGFFLRRAHLCPVGGETAGIFRQFFPAHANGGRAHDEPCGLPGHTQRVEFFGEAGDKRGEPITFRFILNAA